MSWITRSGVVSLSLTPVHPFTIDREAAWSEAVQYFQNHPIYTGIQNSTKYTSMYNQYLCHVYLASGLKTPWNLEPAKPDKGYSGFFNNQCN